MQEYIGMYERLPCKNIGKCVGVCAAPLPPTLSCKLAFVFASRLVQVQDLRICSYKALVYVLALCVSWSNVLVRESFFCVGTLCHSS